MDMSRAIELRTARQREHQQAVARPAHVRFVVVVTGVGQTRLTGENGLAFNAWMLEEPTFSFGVICDDPLEEDELPMATATVLGWRTMDATSNLARGDVWLGADVGFRVESTKENINLRFSLTFEGYAMRSLIDTN